MTTPPRSATLATTLARARAEGGVDVPPGLSLNQLARRAGLAASQLSRIENGQLRKPSRAILVAIARALNRNPVPLLVLAGHLSGAGAQVELRDFFRPGAEAPEEWGDWTSVATEVARRALVADPVDDEVLRSIAADLFLIQETVETIWHDAYSLTVATGPGADELRRFAAIIRELDTAERAQVLAHAGVLRDRHDLTYRLAMAQDRIESLESVQR